MIEVLHGIITMILVFSSLMVIIASNSIHAVLFLILSYVSASIILLILKCEFIALIFITIYVGAVAVLFLFVVLLLDIKLYQVNNRLFLYSYSIFLSLIFLVELLFLAFKNFRVNPYLNQGWLTNSHSNLIFKLDMLSDIEVLGQVLSVNFVVQLLTAGLILFLGIVGSIVISINFNLKKAKLQIFYRQFSKSFKSSLVF
uniref:NADH-ubiquinone oxidoreductase chain 6 n=1 Tax=Eunotia naegelii TaxID=1458866 RepID=A0A2U9GHX0_9STRA|nr:NADH dehydrogenase subunit 6 [Eunotia naegelii]AWQ64079.1 NADH dehydrogenase subunit 6 [Eunotia naegelii]